MRVAKYLFFFKSEHRGYAWDDGGEDLVTAPTRTRLRTRLRSKALHVTPLALPQQSATCDGSRLSTAKRNM